METLKGTAAVIGAPTSILLAGSLAQKYGILPESKSKRHLEELKKEKEAKNKANKILNKHKNNKQDGTY